MMSNNEPAPPPHRPGKLAASCTLALVPQRPVRFSLVVATCGRVEEPRALLQSLLAQGPWALEVFIVDQNGDDRLDEVVRTFADQLPIRHLRSSVRNSSHARNLGLAMCTGDVVAFPDDDCIYPPGVLQHVDRCFAADPALRSLSGPAITDTGELSSGRWRAENGLITIDTVWTSVIGFNLFLQREALMAVGGFDEELGVGARFGSSEEPDLVMRLVHAGDKALYDTTLRVIHPDKRLTPAAVSRAFAYGAGMGHVLRKHDAPARLKARFLLRPIGGVVLSLVRARTMATCYYWETLCGRVFGLVSRSRT